MGKRPEDHTEEDVTDETLKKELEDNLEELGGEQEDSSTDKKPQSVSKRSTIRLTSCSNSLRDWRGSILTR